MKKIFIKPLVPGSKVHMEGKPKEFLPQKGVAVERTTYWIRRLNDGSVVKTEQPKTAAKREG